MALSYSDYCDYYAKKCIHCHGEKRILNDRVWVSCSCQDIATYKWRLEKIQVTPSSLKYKEWEDFTGSVGEDTITNSLTPESLINAKLKSMEYCFGSSGASGPSNRKKNLVIQNRINENKNIVISGDKSSGKSLLACLIVKEAIRAKLSIKWLSLSDLWLKVRWTEGRPIDYDFFTDLSDIQFLIVDEVEIDSKNMLSGDMLTLDNFFSKRKDKGFVTIFLCSRRVSQFLKTAPKVLEEKFGKSFIALMSNHNNLFIDLVLQDEVS